MEADTETFWNLMAALVLFEEEFGVWNGSFGVEGG